MNWIKGFERIIISTSFIVFIVVSYFFYPATEFMPKFADINPEYDQERYEEYIERFEREIDFESTEPIPEIPPAKYLPVKLYKRVCVTVIVSLISSVIWIIGLAGIIRIINLVSRWIIRGFKE